MYIYIYYIEQSSEHIYYHIHKPSLKCTLKLIESPHTELSYLPAIVLISYAYTTYLHFMLQQVFRLRHS